MGKRATKIRQMTPAAIEARATAAHQSNVDRLGAIIGLPEIQRDGAALAIVPAAVDGKPRPVDSTVRKFTRVQRLARSGALDLHHVAAINRYVEIAEIAYGGVMKACSYGEGGNGSSYISAASAAHTRLLESADNSDKYRAARAHLPGVYVAPFERIVLDNHPIGLVGSSVWPTSSAGVISSAMRDMIRTCADHLCAAFGIDAPEPRQHLITTMKRMDQAVRAVRVEATLQPISDAISAKLDAWEALVGLSLLVSPAVLADLCREAGVDVMLDFRGVPITVVEHWSFGWMVQRADT